MIKAQNIKCNARSRRDERRKQKQREFAAANPMMAGRKYQNVGETVAPTQRPGYLPKSLNSCAILAKREVIDYRNQIIRATYLFNHEFKRIPAVEGPACLPEVAIFAAGHRKSSPVTAR